MLPLLVGLGVAYLLASEPKRRRSSRKARPAWQHAEKKACKRRGLKHDGRSGRADCGRSIEVKHWSRPVDAGTIRREHAKGRTEIVAASGYGFTKPARQLARKKGVRLSHR